MSSTDKEPHRLDAPEKVTGAALFASDLKVADCLHGALVLSPIPAGEIMGLDRRRAAQSPDVVGLYAHDNAPRVAPGPYRTWLQDGIVHHAGQPVALVVAESPEAARTAATTLAVSYRTQYPLPRMHEAKAVIDVAGDIHGKSGDTTRGDLALGRLQAQTHGRAQYTTPTHCHNPIERGVVLVRPNGAGLEVFTATSGIFAARRTLAQALDMAETDIVVNMLYQGAGFGAKGGAWWPSLILAASVARELGRPVKLELTRQQMFTVSGRRAPTRQVVWLGATQEGRLAYLEHEAIQETSPLARYADPTCFATRAVYACANVATRHRLITTNIPQPNAMRAPGETPGSFALESAIDELACGLGLDPVDLRLANIASRDEHAGRDWSSNGLAACLREGARLFGWHGGRANTTVRREGRWLTGQGVASAYYPVHQSHAQASLVLDREGRVVLSCGNQDIGNGGRTVMAQAAAGVLGLAADAIVVRYGDTTLPETPMAAGSMSTASVVPAIEAAATSLKAKLIAAACSSADTVFAGRSSADIAWRSVAEIVSADGVRSDAASLVAALGIEQIAASAATQVADNGFSNSAFGACFVRVKVDMGLGILRLATVTGVYALGRVVNHRLTRSQLVGGLIGGIGGALMECLDEDPETRIPLNRNLSDYLMPTCADIPPIDVRILPEPDRNPATTGIKGAGMIGSVGIAASIANAVFDATGIRVRDLPVSVEALLRAG